MGRVVILVMLMALCSLACAQDEQLALKSSLPASIRAALFHLCEPCELADQDEPWNPTDVIDGSPQRLSQEALIGVLVGSFSTITGA
jgi:hypothetical protein